MFNNSDCSSDTTAEQEAPLTCGAANGASQKGGAPGSPWHPDFPGLLPRHGEHLRASGISDDVVRERGYESVLGKKQLIDLGFAEYQARKPGLLIPWFAPDGSNGVYQYRPDDPRIRDEKVVKYETPPRTGLRLDVPPRCRPMLADPSIPLYITEGVKKGDAGASHGLCIIALPGVWGFRGRNAFGATTWLADWQCIALTGRTVPIVFDSDVMTKAGVQKALAMLTEMLRRQGAEIRHIYLPAGPNGEKVGLDDFLLNHTVEELDRYTVVPTTAPEAKTPRVVRQLAPGDDRHLSDLGNAKRLADRHGPSMRYCYVWGKWVVYTGKRWEEDQRGQVNRWAKKTVFGIYREAASAAEEAQRRAIAEWAMTSESALRIAAMIKLAESEVPITPDELDRDPWLLNVENGTLDLRTGTLRPHAAEDFITKLAPVAYDPDATCPIFDRFLERVLPDADVRTFVQCAVGYSLTGDVSEQVLMFLHGPGANGKSTLLNALLGVLGDYGKQAAPDLLVVKRGETHPTEIADIAGVRFLSTIEVEEGRRMAEGLVKQMTGGDPLKARRMREDFWQFFPTHKVWFAANHKPIVNGTDYAIWRRIRLVPFDVTIPPAERDRHLGTKLRAEFSGILRWAVQGCLDWQRHGLGTPDEIANATEQYREEMDVLATFLDERCLVAKTARVAKAAFYKAYCEWCEANGEKYETQRVLSGRMTERGFDDDRGTGGVHMWLGVGLLTSTEGAAPRGGE